MTSSRNILRATGALLVAWAVFDALWGPAQPALSWGPALFRLLLVFHGFVLIGFSSRSHTPEQPAKRGAIGGRTLWMLIGLSAVAFALRIPGLNSCMWLDEILTMVRFARPPVYQILTTFPDQNQHMLYSLLAHASMLSFGEQVWSLRLPSVFFGVASIWALFLVGRHLIGEKQALLACVLMTVSYHHIWFSGNARGYMGLLFFTLLASWLWLEAMERNAWRTWMGYAAAITLGMWIHMTMLFVVAVHALMFLIVWFSSDRRPDRLGRGLMAFVLCGTLTLQVYALSLPEFLRTGLSEFSPTSEWTNPLWVVKESLHSLQRGFAAFAVVVCGGLLAAAGWTGILRRSAPAAWAMVLPGAIGGGLMLALGHNLWPRFFFFSMGFGLLIVIHGAMEMPRLFGRTAGLSGKWSSGLGYAAAGLMILASATTVPRCYAFPKQDFTGARAYVEAALKDGDEVAVAGLAEHAYGRYYAPSWKVVRTPEELAALRSNARRTFVVYTLPIELRAAHADLWKAIQAEFETEQVFPGTLGGGEVYVCRDRHRANAVAQSR